MLSTPSRLASAPIWWVITDVDFESDPDLVVANGRPLNGGTVSILLGAPNETFAAPTTIAGGGGQVRELVVDDLDLDGTLDLVLANTGFEPGTTNVSVLLNTGVDPVGSSIRRLYLAVHGRAPDLAGFAYWTRQLRLGVPIEAIADAFIAAPESASRYAGLSDDAYVDSLYRTVHRRETDAGGFAFWSDLLRSGVLSRGGVMAGFSESQESKNRGGRF